MRRAHAREARDGIGVTLRPERHDEDVGFELPAVDGGRPAHGVEGLKFFAAPDIDTAAAQGLERALAQTMGLHAGDAPVLPQAHGEGLPAVDQDDLIGGSEALAEAQGG